MVASNYSYFQRSSLFQTNISHDRAEPVGAAVQMENGQWLPFAELNHGLIWSVRSGRAGGWKESTLKCIFLCKRLLESRTAALASSCNLLQSILRFRGENVPKLNCRLSCLLACLLPVLVQGRNCFQSTRLPAQSAKLPSFTTAEQQGSIFPSYFFGVSY